MSVYSHKKMKEKSPNFTPRAQQVIKYSKEIALEYNRVEVSPVFLFLGILNLKYGPIRETLGSCQVDSEKLATFIANDIVPSAHKTETQNCKFSETFIDVLKLSSNYSETLGHDYVGIEHIFLALLDHPDSVCVKYFGKFGVSLSQLMDAVHLQFIRGLDNSPRPSKASAAYKPVTAPDKNRALEAFALNYNTMAAQGKFDAIIGREGELGQMVEILCRRKKNNPLLLGEAGVGKTALIEALAQRITTRDVPEALLSKQIYALDLASMIAGTKYRGQFEDRLKKVLAEVKKDKNIILFIDEIHTIIGAGSAEGGLDTANILKPPLSRSEISCIGATTNAEYKKHFSKDAALGRRFESLDIKEPSTSETIEILKGIISKYEEYHNLSYEPECLKLSVELSQKYIQDRRLPDKAIDLIDQAGARVKISSNKKPKKLIALEAEISNVVADAAIKGGFNNADPENSAIFEGYKKALEGWVRSCSRKKATVKPKDLYHVVANKTNIPYDEVSKSESKRLLFLEKTLSKQVVGQNNSISSICKSIIRNRCGLGRANRPVGCFLLLGSTGSGKTHTAQMLAESVFGGRDKLIRFDMTEYSEKISSSRLTGASPGYVGYEEGGQLTERIRKQPYSVVLFDEIEKAHPEVIQSLLQIMDDGILTDNVGKTADFTNSIIILTGNIGSDIISNKSSLGFISSQEQVGKDVAEKVQALARKSFTPEFINRLDEIVVYNNFTDADMRKITRMELNKIKNKLLKRRINLKYTPGVVNFVVELANREKLGARPIHRILSNKIENLIADYILNEERPFDESLTIYKRGTSFLIK
jgi:ATP-dependent Clp protease ATP-binding subunit ClpC